MKMAGAVQASERRHAATALFFARTAVLASGLMLAAATDLMGQLGGVNDTSRSITALAKPGGDVSAGKILIRVDSVSSSTVHIPLFGPSGVASKAEPLLLNVWKPYHLGKTDFLVKATPDGNGKELLFSISVF